MKDWYFAKLLVAAVGRTGWGGRAGVSACGGRRPQTERSWAGLERVLLGRQTGGQAPWGRGAGAMMAETVA